MVQIRKALSVSDDSTQLTDELRLVPKEERNELMKEANFNIQIPPEEGLAMKADLCLPWNKLRIMRRLHWSTSQSLIILDQWFLCRWMKLWKIDVSSEKKQRAVMKADLEKVEVEAESVPFSFHTKRNDLELRPAPIAFVTDLKSLLYHLLDEKDR